MKLLSLGLVFALWIAVAVAAQEPIPTSPKSSASPAPKTAKERGAYAVGLGIGRTLQAQGLDDLDLAFLARGIKDSLTGVTPALNDKELDDAMQSLKKSAMARVAARNKAEGERNKAEAERFFAANAKKEGVKSTKSGLQYKVLKQGSGPSPRESDTVRTHYHGTFLNGEVFDSSVQRQEPAEFAVNEVIPAWTEALKMMKVGSKWQLFVPAKLAYGEQGFQGIPPNAALIFEVELLDIVGVKAKP